MSKQVWFFIDIDGCIMPDIFSDVFYTNDHKKLISIASTYKIVMEKEIKLYPEFIDFYRRIISNTGYDIMGITFVTGRQDNCFGWLTEKQLRPLEKIRWFHVYYFYNFAKHTWDVYKNFKIQAILNSLEFEEFRGIIKVYDDFNLEVELYQALDRPFKFHLIKKKEDWNKLELKKLEKEV